MTSNQNILLQQAAAENDSKAAAALLKAGANPYFLNERGQTAFNCAASNGLQALSLMTEEAFRDTQRLPSQKKWGAFGLNTPSGLYGSSLITYAVKACSLELVREMIDAGADITIVNGSGWTLLHSAAVMPKREEVLKELLRAFKRQGHTSLLGARSTHIYETHYNGYKVIYSEGLDARELCLARIAQDPECPKELTDYTALDYNLELCPKNAVFPQNPTSYLPLTRNFQKTTLITKINTTK